MTAPTSTEVLRYAGDYRLDKIAIVNSTGTLYSPLNQLVTLEIFEDMLSPFITGTLTFKESLDIMDNLPLSGEERLLLSISTPEYSDFTLSGDFYIYKVSNYVQSGDRSAVFQLNFISTEALVDASRKISKRFQGTPSDIVKDLISNVTYGLGASVYPNVEQTTNKISYVSNFWSPVRNINYLSENSLNNNNDPVFFFFQNRNGMNFICLQTLVANDALMQQFIQDKFSRDAVYGGQSVRNITEEFRRITDFRAVEQFDYLDQLRKGMMGSTLFNYDMTNHQVTKVAYDRMTDPLKQNDLLNPNGLHSLNVLYSQDAKHLHTTTSTGLFNGVAPTDNNSTYIQRRLAELRAMGGNVYQFSAAGQVGYTVGAKVSLTVYKNQATNKADGAKDMIDMTISGNYIVQRLRHVFTRATSAETSMHRCIFEVVKNSLQRDLNNP